MKYLGAINNNKDLVTKEFVEGKGYYTKPSSGIPVDDLSSEVQEALSGSNVVVRETYTVSTANTTSISIPINISSTSNLVVYHNGLLLTSGIHYTASITEITLLNYTAKIGDIFTFVGSLADPGETLDISAQAVLFSDSENYGSCTNVYEALEHVAYKESLMEEDINSRLDTLLMLASEASFRSRVNSKVQEYEFDYFCIEVFDTSTDIDTTKDNGATVVANYFNSEKHIIHKTSSDTLTIQSRLFNVSSTPYKVWIYADWDGAGSLSLQFSKNDGEDWISITNDTLVDLNVLVQKKIRVKVTMTGEVRLKNIGWGCK